MKQDLFSLHSSSQKETSVSIDILEVKEAALVLRAVNHKLRQKMLNLIHEKGEIKVIDLYKQLNLIHPIASLHLAILRKAGCVSTRKESSYVYYSINVKRIEELSKLVPKLASFTQSRS